MRAGGRGLGRTNAEFVQHLPLRARQRLDVRRPRQIGRGRLRVGSVSGSPNRSEGEPVSEHDALVGFGPHLFTLAEELGSVSAACRAMGVDRSRPAAHWHQLGIRSTGPARSAR